MGSPYRTILFERQIKGEHSIENNGRTYLMNDVTGEVGCTAPEAREILLGLLPRQKGNLSNPELLRSMADEYLRQYPDDLEIKALRDARYPVAKEIVSDSVQHPDNYRSDTMKKVMLMMFALAVMGVCTYVTVTYG